VSQGHRDPERTHRCQRVARPA